VVQQYHVIVACTKRDAIYDRQVGAKGKKEGTKKTKEGSLGPSTDLGDHSDDECSRNNPFDVAHRAECFYIFAFAGAVTRFPCT
jgi:hypothetical protein